MRTINTGDGIVIMEWSQGMGGPAVYFQTANSKGITISVCSKNSFEGTHTAKGYIGGWFPEGVTKKIAELMVLPFEELWEMAGGPKR